MGFESSLESVGRSIAVGVLPPAVRQDRVLSFTLDVPPSCVLSDGGGGRAREPFRSDSAVGKCCGGMSSVVRNGDGGSDAAWWAAAAYAA